MESDEMESDDMESDEVESDEVESDEVESDEMKTQHKVAIVTGAAKMESMGFMVAVGLAREGFDIVGADLYEAGFAHVKDAVARFGRRAVCVRTDVINPDDVEEMVRRALSEFGRIDVLVNAAGGSWAIRPDDIENGAPPQWAIGAWNATLEEWRTIVGVNLDAVFYACRAVVPYMMAAKSGRIVNFSSVAGRQGGTPESVVSSGPYAVAKAGVIGLTKQLAMELGPYGITVNAVAPGIIASWRGQRALSNLPESERKAMESTIPMGRMGSSEEVSEMVVALCTDEMKYMTGTVVDINGGMYSA
ncbi:SDR family oxidoreductase [Alicyclobacillus curvatus]|nr:SDR family oxidoreductase [Alicyclobacillus curvatus]